ncbi:hypothetical protein GYMLUDRAFT_182599 [Collybiopsis luxurians FD-317 M1]|uniref:Tubulin nucleotide-binding domain-like protein n=1 Tax=Collybiopsis luxurians FD-317 M1 TaxID=944289 RepID=A0A0D0BYS8_9AGAR|nr:hypothetical protein GYMLUDRAFT_182599 [Collybiopsis luxurians FD-317 M1]
MREILYIQAGNVSNYIGTHFWNTQESYFTYADEEDSLVNHDISFREGPSFKGDPTYNPRLIAFDHKGNFGALAKTNNLAGNEQLASKPLWNGSITEYEQEPIEPHVYQTHLEAEDSTFSADASAIRYWSDFNRVFYTPRTIQMVPDVPDWRNSEGDWSLGQEIFERLDDETELMEGSVRLFLEECNSFQGLQLTTDTSTFGSFSYSFLMAFHDELSRAPCLSFPLMTDAVPRNINLENKLHVRKVFNDAVYLRELGNLSLLTVPLQNPTTWSNGDWKMNLKLDGSIYQNSSILSAHIESSTAPLRLKGKTEHLSNFATHLNIHGSHYFGQLSGLFPVAAAVTPETFRNQLYNFSMTCYARRDVTRGFSPNALHAYESWCSRTSIKEPYAMSTHSVAYPLPSSFPDIFRDETMLYDSRKNTPTGPSFQLPSIASFSMLSTDTSTAEAFADYARFIQICIDRRRTGILTGKIETLDDMKELVNDLWTIHDGYSEYINDSPDSDGV